MKKIITSTIVCCTAMLVGKSYAMDVKPFIGANIGINGVAYDEDVYDDNYDAGIEMPEAFFGAGVEAGIRFQTPRVYNAGVVFSYDYAFDTEADLSYPAEDMIDSWKQGFSAISITFDNYLRVSGNAKHRQDIVLGLGLGRATSRFQLDPTIDGILMGLDYTKESDKDTVVVLKVGYNYNFASDFDWYLNGRWFIPSDNDFVKALFNANAGIRFIF